MNGQGNRSKLNPDAVPFTPRQPLRPDRLTRPKDTERNTKRAGDVRFPPERPYEPTKSGNTRVVPAAGVNNSTKHNPFNNNRDIPYPNDSNTAPSSTEGTEFRGTALLDGRTDLRDPIYTENPNPAFLYGPRLIPGRPTIPPISSIQGLDDPIPLYGALHGMHVNPKTKLFTGDGPPRSTAARADGTGPCTAAMNAVRDPTAGGKVLDDQIHIQTKDFVEKAMEKFGKDGNVKVWEVQRPEESRPQREGEVLGFRDIERAKQEMKARHGKETEDCEIVAGAGGKTTVGEEAKQDTNVAGSKVRDFEEEPQRKKKRNSSTDRRRPPTMAEKLKAQFAKGL